MALVPMTLEPTRRRWFRFAFSLRAMFVVVTVLASVMGWLFWQYDAVHKRQKLLAELRQTYPNRVEYNGLESMEAVAVMFNGSYDYARVSAFRRFLGDETCVQLTFPFSPDTRLAEQAELLFPEPQIVLIAGGHPVAIRPSLLMPETQRPANLGTVFKTGLIEKP